MTLIDKIKKYGKLRNMNLKQVAIKAGLSENTIYGWNKHQPTRATVEAVARVIGTTYEELTGEEGSSTPKSLDLKEAIDNEDIIKTYDGKPIPAEDLALIKRLMRGE